MALSKSARTKRDGSISITDGDTLANSLTVSCEPGDFNYSAPGYATERFLDRTEHKSPRKGDAQVTTLGFSVLVTTATSTTEATIPDICEYWSRPTSWVGTEWVSTLDTESDEFTVTVTYTIDGSYVSESDVSLVFSDVSLRGSFAEGSPDTYTVTGEASIIGPTVS